MWRNHFTRLLPVPPAGEEDLGRHPNHPAGHDGVGRLRRLTELHPQPLLRVGQVQCF